METKSTRAPARRKSVSTPQAIQLTSAMIASHSREQALKEWRAFMDNHTRAEMKVVGHLIVSDYTPQELMKEIRRLLGESIAKCKVIPFPVRNSQSKPVMGGLI